MTIHLAAPHISRRHIRKRKSWTIIGLFSVPLISTKDEEPDLPSLYWIPKLHKCLFKQRYIAGFAKCQSRVSDYEAYSIQGLLKKNEKKLARFFNFTFRYIDDVLLLNNSRFGDFVDRIYHIELEIKDTTATDGSASYLDIHLEIVSEGRLRTKLYDKRDAFNFPIVNFLFICSNIPAAPTYGVYISQLIRYSRACGSYQDFLDLELLLTRKLLNHGFLLVKLKSSFRKCYARHHDVVDRYGISSHT